MEADRRGKKSIYILSVFFYLLAMLAKTSVITLPFILILYCWWKRQKVTWQNIRSTIPYCLIAIILGFVTICFHLMHADKATMIEDKELFSPLLGSIIIVLFYIGKFFIPIELQPTYPDRMFFSQSPNYLLVFSIVLLMLTRLLYQKRLWHKHIILGFAFFIINLLPILGFIIARHANMIWSLDHLAYISIIGLIGLTVAGFEIALLLSNKSIRLILISAACAICLILVWNSHKYTKVFINKYTLFTYALKGNPESWYLHNALGATLAAMPNRRSEAIAQLEEAVRINPNSTIAQYDLGVVLMSVADRLEEAIEHYEIALKLEPNNFHAQYALGCLLLRYPDKLPLATSQLERSLRLDPDFKEDQPSLGIALGNTPSERLPDAITVFTTLIKAHPDVSKAHFDLGILQLAVGRPIEAVHELKTALKLDPEFDPVHEPFGDALLAIGRQDDAIKQFEIALQHNPNLSQVYYNLGNCFMQAGQFDKAVEQYKETLKITPDDYAAHANLGGAFRALGDIPDAINEYNEVLRIKPDNSIAKINLEKIKLLRATSQSK